MPLLPRDQILDATDLPTLADELLGPRRGRGPFATWPCPSPHHGPQTGRTPPVSIFTSSRGYQRWHCHAYGAGGTAIDLLLETSGLNVRQALEHLAQHDGINTDIPKPRAPTRPAAWPDAAPHPRAASYARRALADHVDRCEEILWSKTGQPMLEYLHARGLHDEILRSNHVGADPGPRHLPRAQGLPARGPAVIFPIHDNHGPIYLQARYLNPDQAGGRKYDNPASWVATNPRYAPVATPTPIPSPAAQHEQLLFVCEGLPDALTVAQAGSQAIALLGVGLAGKQLVEYIHAHHPLVPIVVAFDGDSRGVASTHTLAEGLRRAGQSAVHELKVPPLANDLNHWASVEPTFGDAFASTVDALLQNQRSRLVPNQDMLIATHRRR